MSEYTNHSDASTYRADREFENKECATKEPACILDLPKGNSFRVPLAGEEAELAKKELFNNEFAKLKFPRTMTARVDPRITRQNFGLLTFIPSKNATPDQDGCFGVVKFRGAFDTAKEAEDTAYDLITKHDSYSEIDLVRIGIEFPLLVDNTIYTASTREIDIRQKLDDTVKADFKKKREQEQKDIKDIQERRQKLIDGEHKEEQYKSIDDIDMYLQLRVKKANALMALDESKKTIETSEDIINKTDVTLKELEEKNPTFVDEYLERYERALTAVGANPQQNPLIKYMKEEINSSSSSSN